MSTTMPPSHFRYTLEPARVLAQHRLNAAWHDLAGAMTRLAEARQRLSVWQERCRQAQQHLQPSPGHTFDPMRQLMAWQHYEALVHDAALAKQHCQQCEQQVEEHRLIWQKRQARLEALEADRAQAWQELLRHQHQKTEREGQELWHQRRHAHDAAPRSETPCP